MGANIINEQVQFPSGVVLDQGRFELIVPEGTTNVVANPSYEIEDYDTRTFNGTGGRTSSVQSRGAYGYLVTPSIVAADANKKSFVERLIGNNFNALVAQTDYIWSVDIGGDLNDSFTMEAEEVHGVDSFNRLLSAATASTPSESTNANWIPASVGASMAASAGAGGFGGRWYFSAGSTGTDVSVTAWVTGDFDNGSGNMASPDIFVRGTASDTTAQTYIFARLLSTGINAGNISIYKRVAGVTTLLATNSVPVGSGGIIDGTFYGIRLTSSGQTITAALSMSQYWQDHVTVSYTLSAGEQAVFTVSLDKYGVLAESAGVPFWSPTYRYFKATNPTPRTLATKTFNTSVALDRYFLPFTYNPSATRFNGGVLLRITKNTQMGGPSARYVTSTWYHDGHQIEAKSNPTSYVDGDILNCVWTGVAHRTSSVRPEGIQGGRTYTFDNDFNLQTIGVQSFGLQNPVNQVTPYGTRGGAFLQRTVMPIRNLSILVKASSTGVQAALHRIRQVLIGAVSPNTNTQQAKALRIRYRLFNKCLNAAYTPLQMDCTYTGGLSGNTTNPVGEDLTLGFAEYIPGSLSEMQDTGKVISTTPVLSGTITASVLKKTGVTWGTPSLDFNFMISCKTIKYDNMNQLVYGGANRAGVDPLFVKTITGGTATVYAAVFLPGISDLKYFFGGDFTFPGTRFYGIITTAYNYTVFLPTGTSINNTIYGMCADSTGQAIILVGDFTTNGTRIVKYNVLTDTYSTYGTGLSGTGRVAILGPTGYPIIGGAFATANGVTVNGICYHNGTTFVAYGSGVAGGAATVYCACVGTDGRLYIGGSFTTAGGVTVNNIAVWNGSQWQPLGSGLNGTVFGVAFDAYGNLIAVGSFTAISGTGNTITPYVAMWNGSAWVPYDIVLATQLNAVAVAYNQVSLAVNTGTSLVVRSSAVTTINYTGTDAVNPRIRITCATGPWTIYSLINTTTNTPIYFNYTMVAGEVIWVNPIPGNISVRSSVNGDIMAYMGQGTDYSLGFSPGANAVGPNVLTFTSASNGTGEVVAIYKNRHFSFDYVGNLS